MKLEAVRGTRSMYSSAENLPRVQSKCATGLALSQLLGGPLSALEPVQPIARWDGCDGETDEARAEIGAAGAVLNAQTCPCFADAADVHAACEGSHLGFSV